jgi:hypothetical protein
VSPCHLGRPNKMGGLPEPDTSLSSDFNEVIFLCVSFSELLNICRWWARRYFQMKFIYILILVEDDHSMADIPNLIQRTKKKAAMFTLSVISAQLLHLRTSAKIIRYWSEKTVCKSQSCFEHGASFCSIPQLHKWEINISYYFITISLVSPSKLQQFSKLTVIGLPFAYSEALEWRGPFLCRHTISVGRIKWEHFWSPIPPLPLASMK